MLQNSAFLASFVRESRRCRGWSQEQVNEAGGPYRQAQAQIENGESTISEQHLKSLEWAYRWPSGYLGALAAIGEDSESDHSGVGPAGGKRDAAALASRYGHEATSRSVYKTFSGLYTKPETGQYFHSRPCLGFDPVTGEPIRVEGPVVTNVPFEHLHPMMLAHHGATLIDVNAGDERAMNSVASRHSNGNIAESAAQQPVRIYRSGSALAGVEAIAIDPLSDITSLAEAKNLAAGLKEIYRDAPVSVMQAAFTFLAIAAFGEDPIVTMTRLLRNDGDYPFAKQFEEFWADFYDPTKAGPDLARPSVTACRLLTGVLAARDQGLSVDIDSGAGRRKAQYQEARTLNLESILAPDTDPSVLFYDSRTAPELPVAVSHQWRPSTLTFYSLDGQCKQPLLGPGTPYFSVGVTSANDVDVLARHASDDVGTLTNYRSGQAVYSEGRRARRVWIPDL